MPEKYLHIISFAIPFPPNYGGVIDVYYKILALTKAGVKVHLHCFEYRREASELLETICHKVYYYPRKTGLLAALSIKPYIVASRRSTVLLNNLLMNNYPILFEGLHSCYYIGNKLLENRFKIYRESNIEHHYYYHLARAEKNLFRKLYFSVASLKLKLYQPQLRHAQLILAVSKSDASYLTKYFPLNKVVYLPSFHPSEDLKVRSGMGDFILYHGNLSVAENMVATDFLINNVFAKLKYNCVIAGLNPPASLARLVQQFPHIKLIASPGDDEIFELIRTAQINVLVTFQATGLKLKLLNTLFNGKHVLVNSQMLVGTGLDELCTIADTADQLMEKINNLMQTEFDTSLLEKRRQALKVDYFNATNAEKLIKLIFGNG